MARDEDFWARPRDFGGERGPQSLDRLREGAGGVIAASYYASQREIGMAGAILMLLDMLADARGEDRRPPGIVAPRGKKLGPDSLGNA